MHTSCLAPHPDPATIPSGSTSHPPPPLVSWGRGHATSTRSPLFITTLHRTPMVGTRRCAAAERGGLLPAGRGRPRVCAGECATGSERKTACARASLPPLPGPLLPPLSARRPRPAARAHPRYILVLPLCGPPATLSPSSCALTGPEGRHQGEQAVTKTQLPYDYYTLPFCKPAEIVNKVENLGGAARLGHPELALRDLLGKSDFKVLCRVELTKKTSTCSPSASRRTTACT